MVLSYVFKIRYKDLHWYIFTYILQNSCSKGKYLLYIESNIRNRNNIRSLLSFLYLYLDNLSSYILKEGFIRDINYIASDIISAHIPRIRIENIILLSLDNLLTKFEQIGVIVDKNKSHEELISIMYSFLCDHPLARILYNAQNVNKTFTRTLKYLLRPAYTYKINFYKLTHRIEKEHKKMHKLESKIKKINDRLLSLQLEKNSLNSLL